MIAARQSVRQARAGNVGRRKIADGSNLRVICQLRERLRILSTASLPIAGTARPRFAKSTALGVATTLV